MTDAVTFRYNPTPELPRRDPIPAGTAVYAMSAEGVWEQVAVTGPPVAIDHSEIRQFLLPVPRTWQTEGGDQA